MSFAWLRYKGLTRSARLLRLMSDSALTLTSQKFTIPHIPELFDPNFLNVLLPPPASSNDVLMEESDKVQPVPTNAMMEALQRSANHTFTANGAPALSTTNSPTLDAFLGLHSWIKAPEIDVLLTNSWKEDPGLTLRLIWQLRSIHDGKAEKEGFYRAFGWLYKKHPRTAIANLPMLVAPVCTNKKEPSLPFSHGYWKDLLNILALASTDELDTVNAKFLHHPRSPFNYRDRKVKVNASPEAHRQFIIQIQERAKAERTRIAGERHEILIKRLQDSKYRALYVAVSRLFADQLVKDLQVIDQLDHLPPGQDRIPLLKKLSLAGKWAPTPGASHDRVTNVASAISLLLHHSRSSIPRPFPKALSTFDGSQAESTNPYLILRSYYHRWVLVPLRSLLLVPETLMSANKWSTIRYNRVSSLSMKSNMEHFFKHDPDRFQQYLVDVESGKKTISGATLLPHQIVTEVVKLHNDLQADTVKSKYPKLAEMRKERAVPQLRVLDGQWKSLIDRLKQSGTLDSSLAICDVSGSMGSLSGSNSRHPSPIAPAIALSLVLAQLVKPPFNQAFITFSADPQIVTLNPELSLAETIETMQNSAWGMNTDFNATFLKLLLPLAVKNKVPKEEMIKQLFVFSDMQFDEASGQEYMDWKTNHDVIAEAYAEAGYDMPKIIYWDLAGNGTMEVTAEREGVAMMNGFSASMLKVFMGEEEEDEGWEKVGKTDKETDEDKFNPLIIMKKSVMKLSFDGLVVLD